MKFHALLTFTALVSFSGMSQTSEMANHQIALTNDYQIMVNRIDEVYGVGYPPEDIRRELMILMVERISFKTEPAGEKDYPLLSSLELKNSTNTSIAPFVPGEFDRSLFNPLKYNFNFFDSRNYQWFRIDGTEYVMIVSPYNPGK